MGTRPRQTFIIYICPRLPGGPCILQTCNNLSPCRPHCFYRLGPIETMGHIIVGPEEGLRRGYFTSIARTNIRSNVTNYYCPPACSGEPGGKLHSSGYSVGWGAPPACTVQRPSGAALLFNGGGRVGASATISPTPYYFKGSDPQ